MGIRSWRALHLPRLAALAVLLAALTAAAALPARAADVTVFAAASLTDALGEAARAYETRTGAAITLSFAGSSALARQIQQGAPADLFISANADWMDRLQADGLIAEDTRTDLLRNSLVLIAPTEDTAPLEDAPPMLGPRTDLRGLLGDGRLAMALVEAVPAGIYGKAALETLGLWEAVAPRVAQADNVRAALALVATGEAPLGIVYATDAAAEDDVRILATIPPETHPPILYPAAAVAGRESADARAFLAFLTGSEAEAIFRRHGFRPVQAP
jgi:molybdate transport system substrate-binding protein